MRAKSLRMRNYYYSCLSTTHDMFVFATKMPNIKILLLVVFTSFYVAWSNISDGVGCHCLFPSYKDNTNPCSREKRVTHTMMQTYFYADCTVSVLVLMLNSLSKKPLHHLLIGLSVSILCYFILPLPFKGKCYTSFLTTFIWQHWV